MVDSEWKGSRGGGNGGNEGEERRDVGNVMKGWVRMRMQWDGIGIGCGIGGRKCGIKCKCEYARKRGIHVVEGVVSLRQFVIRRRMVNPTQRSY
jgi:hypothetical protein